MAFQRCLQLAANVRKSLPLLQEFIKDLGDFSLGFYNLIHNIDVYDHTEFSGHRTALEISSQKKRP